ncbi:MAG: diaminopimelate decarboxylase [Chloroflexota bacterium]|jgi:diaminopimelate decarboxylase|nr:diaminopimelate decarboxylase [Chloroflexota bacterium]MDH5243090.1 diaminopimelate decarboxylase [Chloroflexota bacterium]
MTLVSAAPWWVRPGLDIGEDGRLRVAGRDAEALAREHGTPLFVYDRARFAENARRLQAAFSRTDVPFRLRFALKANPLPEVLDVFRGLGAPGTPESIGIDACSPGEVLRALECGWIADEISFTGTNVSERDLDVLLAHRIHVNLDAVSQIERYGRRAPGSRIGLRIDPAVGAGYGAHLEYSGSRPMKFGIGLDRLEDALAAVARHDLVVDTIHFHAGSGWLADGLAGFERALPVAAEAVHRARAAGHPIQEVNVGGGIGMPAREDERPVDLDAYAGVIARHLHPLGVTVSAEPGDGLTKDAAVILGEVVTIETRRGVTFVGLDLGWNVSCAYFIYKFAQELVVCRAAGAERTQTVTVAGHINEASDVFAEDYPMPTVVEGDIVALLNGGGYHQAMSSTHCLRPMAGAIFLDR